MWSFRRYFFCGIVLRLPASNNFIIVLERSVLELYLYNLPVLDLGNGIYYPGWVTDANKKRPLKHLIDYRYGLDLIYGMTVSNNNLFKTISTFIHLYSNKEQIKEYPYLKNHPLFGNSYMEHLDEISNSIINCCKSHHLKSNNI